MDILSKLKWVIPFRDKKGFTITNAFQKLLNKCNRKQNRIWVDKASEFYNRSMKSWLEKNALEMYLTHNEGKSIIAEIFIRSLALIKLGFLKAVSSGGKRGSLWVNLNISSRANQWQYKFIQLLNDPFRAAWKQ